MSIIFSLPFLIGSLIIISFSTYYFQIKEYRFDRMISALKEYGILFFLLPERFLLPKKSIRNINIALIASSLSGLYYLVIVLLNTTTIFKFGLNTAGLFISLLLVCIGVVITERISQKNRNRIIQIAKNKVSNSHTTFIGITGSYGKSSTKEYLHHVISSHFETGKTVKNYNTNVGVALSINENLQAKTKYFIVEMGAYKIGEIKEICNWIIPSYAIITGLSNQHLSLFGSSENLIKAKAELIQALPESGLVYINADAQGYEKILQYCKGKKVVLYSKDQGKGINLYLKEYKKIPEGIYTEIAYKEAVFKIKTNLLGKHAVTNLLPIIGLSCELGVPKEKIIKAIAELKNPIGKLSVHQGIKNITFLYDGYSTNVLGFISAIATLGTFEEKNKYIVTKGLIELGKEKEASYENILKDAKSIGARIITTDALLKKLDKENLTTYIKGEADIIQHIKNNINEKAVVLVEGRFSDTFIRSLKINE